MQKVLLLYGGSSAVVGFLAATLLGLLLWPSGQETAPLETSVASSTSEPEAAGISGQASPENAPETTGAPSSLNSASLAAAPAAPAAERAADPSAPESQPAEPAEPPDPLALRRAETDERIKGFELPARVWACDYDAANGRLAVSHDERGVLIYDVAKLQQGQLSPMHIVPLDGKKPTSLCFKSDGDRRMMFVSVLDEPAIRVFDAVSFEKLPELKLPQLEWVLNLATSQNPQDPYLYLIAVDRHGSYFRHRVARFHLKELELHCYSATGQMLDVSDAGDRLCVQTFGYQAPADATYNIIGSVLEPAQPLSEGAKDCRYLKNALFRWPYIRSADGLVAICRVNADLIDAFEAKPIVVGTEYTRLRFYSSNDYRELLAVPLPEEWKNDLEHSPFPDGEQRQRRALYSNDVFADDARDLAVIRMQSKLVLAPLTKLDLPKEVDLRPQNSLPTTLTVGEGATAELELPAGAAVEFLPTRVGLPSAANSAGTVVGGEPAEKPIAGEFPPLAIPVEIKHQSLYFHVSNLLGNLRFPATLLVDGETMVATAAHRTNLEGERNQLVPVIDVTVQRPNPSAHPLNAKISVVPQAESLQARTAPDMPQIAGNQVTWKPKPSVIGHQHIRLRITKDNAAHEMLWTVESRLPQLQLPFSIYGIKCQVDGHRAVCWGRVADQTAKNPWRLAIVDLTLQTEPRIHELEKPAACACLDERAVYLCVDARNNDVGWPDYIANPRPESNPPTEIWMLDTDTFKQRGKVSIPRHTFQMESVGGRELILTSLPDLKIELPELKIHTVEERNQPMLLGGPVGKGWYSDGMVMDWAMRKPKLIVYPEGVRQESLVPYLIDDTRVDGYQVNTWSEERYNPLPQHAHLLYNWPGAVRAFEGTLQFYSLADTSNFTHDTLKPAFSVWLFDRDRGEIMGKAHSSWSKSSWRYDVPVSCSFDRVAIGYLDRIWIAPTSMFTSDTEPFHLEQEQSHFVLNALKTTKVRYHAPGAISYKLTLRTETDARSRSGKIMELESKDGEFELTFEKGSLASKAASAVKAADAGNPTPQEVRAYLQSITPDYDRLTGRKPSGILVPIFAEVIAQHADGRQQACLAHVYLVEVPASELPKSPQRNRFRQGFPSQPAG